MTPDSYKTERQKRGTQTGVAALLGVNRVTVAKREAGMQPITREAWLALLALPKTKGRLFAPVTWFGGNENMKKSYYVFQADEGCEEVFLGRAASLRQARRIAAAFVRGERDGLARCDYATARHVTAMLAPPPKTGEPVAWWWGRDKSAYCACLESTAETDD